MDKRTNAIESLSHLARVARTKINTAITEEKLLQSDELFYRNQIENFEYNEKGATVGRMSSQYIVKKTWRSGYLAEINQSLKEADEFRASVDILKELCPDLKSFDVIGNLINFANVLTNFWLPDSKYTEKDIDRLIIAYLDSLLGKPLKFIVEVELTKVVVSVPQLQFDAIGFDKITLRPVTAKDLEYEFPAYNFSSGNVKPYARGVLGDFAYPAAILRIECLARNTDEMAGRIKQALTIFRLFQVAGVDMVGHKIIEPLFISKSIGNMSTNYSGLERYMGALGLYQIDKQNSDKFIKFWQEMAPKIPDGFYRSGQVITNYLTIAYQRYCDALIQTGIFEARIASAVMGLEALLLPDKVEGELSFRLRTYVAKVLGLLGHDALTVKEAVKLAYSIRSTYVHGSKLSKRGERLLVQQHTSLGKFTELALDYLRIIIVVALAIEKTKSDYTLLIEDALISESKHNELIELCMKPKTLV